MSAQHTPGPWQTEEVGKLLSVAMSHEKAWMHFDPAVSSFGYDATEEMLANARLIAAAPELLDALEQIVGRYDPARSRWARKALAAIAKARGEGALIKNCQPVKQGEPV